MKGVFVTGTDTECGKTEVTLALMWSLRQRGMRVLGMKPVAAGCDSTADGLRNMDAQRLRGLGSHQVPYDLVNPYAFEPPIAPHLAAADVGVKIEPEVIRAAAGRLAAQCDFLVVEGIGGWRVPLGPSLSVSHLPRILDLPVILVSGIRLGCLNHSLLTADSILASGMRLAGWIGTQVEREMPFSDENIQALRKLIHAPCLGAVPWLATPDHRQLARYLDLSPLLACT